RAKPSRRRNALMNALSDCSYRNQPKTASDTATITATKYNDIAIHVPGASAEHCCARPKTDGSDVTIKRSGSTIFSGLAQLPHAIRLAIWPVSTYPTYAAATPRTAKG